MTLLTLEALDANDGDCLLLHHGSRTKQAHILIDGGRQGVYTASLRPRLEELRKLHHLGSTQALPIELAVLSHVDADHIAGLLALTGQLVETQESHAAVPWKIRELWLNDFDKVAKNHEAAKIQSHAESGPVEVRAVAASVAQGMTLRDHATQLGIDVNAEFQSGFVARPDDAVVKLTWDDLKITVLSPTATEMKAFEEQWDRSLKMILAGKQAPTPDALVVNAASIVLLVERGPHRLLFTGDARSEDILAGLEVAKLLEDGAPYEVDILKVPHHGAIGNCSRELFQRIHARHYVISADGQHGNPDPPTLDRLWEARGADCTKWTLHVTFAEDEIPAFRAWRKAHPAARIVHRASKAHSVSIDLGDEQL